jgi:hypothetical protein
MSASTGTIQQPLSGKGSFFGLAAMAAAVLLAAALAFGALGLTKPRAVTTTQVPTPITTDQGSRVQIVQVPTPINTDQGSRHSSSQVDFPKLRAS